MERHWCTRKFCFQRTMAPRERSTMASVNTKADAALRRRHVVDVVSRRRRVETMMRWSEIRSVQTVLLQYLSLYLFEHNYSRRNEPRQMLSATGARSVVRLRQKCDERYLTGWIQRGVATATYPWYRNYGTTTRKIKSSHRFTHCRLERKTE